MDEIQEHSLIIDVLRKYGNAYYLGRMARSDNVGTVKWPYSEDSTETMAWFCGYLEEAVHAARETKGSAPL